MSPCTRAMVPRVARLQHLPAEPVCGCDGLLVTLDGIGGMNGWGWVAREGRGGVGPDHSSPQGFPALALWKGLGWWDSVSRGAAHDPGPGLGKQSGAAEANSATVQGLRKDGPHTRTGAAHGPSGAHLELSIGTTAGPASRFTAPGPQHDLLLETHLSLLRSI